MMSTIITRHCNLTKQVSQESLIFVTFPFVEFEKWLSNVIRTSLIVEEECGFSDTADFGHIIYTHYPNGYPDNAYCEWIITVYNPNVAFLTFDSLDLEPCCTCDYIEIR